VAFGLGVWLLLLKMKKYKIKPIIMTDIIIGITNFFIIAIIPSLRNKSGTKIFFQ